MCGYNGPWASVSPRKTLRRFSVCALTATMLLFYPIFLMAQAPQIPLSGNIGTGFNGPLINSPAVVFATDADHTMIYPEMSGSGGALVLTSTVSLTTTRNLLAPSTGKFTWSVLNKTTGGQSITVKVSGGTGVTITNGATATILCDQVNCYAPSVAGGVTSTSATSPIQVNGGAGPATGGVTVSCPSCGTLTAVTAGDIPTAGNFAITTTTVPSAGVASFTWTLADAPPYSVWGNFSNAVGIPRYGSLSVPMLPITPSGNTTVFGSANGSFIAGDGVTTDANHNFIDTGTPATTAGFNPISCVSSIAIIPSGTNSIVLSCAVSTITIPNGPTTGSPCTTIQVSQNSTGGFTFTGWSANTRGTMTVSPVANSFNSQSLCWNPTVSTWIARDGLINQ